MLNVGMYTPRLPIQGRGPIIHTGAPTTAGGIAGLIAAGLGGWQAGKQEKRTEAMQERQMGMQEKHTEAQIEAEKARQAYYGRPATAKAGMSPQQEYAALLKMAPTFMAVDATTQLPMSENPMIKPIYEGWQRRIKMLQAQLGIEGSPVDMSIDARRAAANAQFGSPGQEPMPPAGKTVNPAMGAGFGAGAGLAANIMAEPGATTPATGGRLSDLLGTGILAGGSAGATGPLRVRNSATGQTGVVTDPEEIDQILNGQMADWEPIE